MSGIERNGGARDGGARPREVAAYVGTLSRDLSMMSRRNGLVTLAYLLDMASLEAEIAAGGIEDGSAPDVD